MGSESDTDPQYPWAGAILTNQQIGDQAIRADRLFEELRQYMDRVAGPKFQHTLEALRRVKSVTLDTIQDRDEDLESRMLARLDIIFPEKSSYVGEVALRRLVGNGLNIGGPVASHWNAV